VVNLITFTFHQFTGNHGRLVRHWCESSERRWKSWFTISSTRWPKR